MALWFLFLVLVFFSPFKAPPLWRRARWKGRGEPGWGQGKEGWVGGGRERGGSLCPLFDLCLHMTRQEITDERRQWLLSNKHRGRMPSFAETYPVWERLNPWVIPAESLGTVVANAAAHRSVASRPIIIVSSSSFVNPLLLDTVYFLPGVIHSKGD